MLVLGFAESAVLADAIARHLNTDCAVIDIHTFPDGESRVRLPTGLPPKVVLCRSLDHPNDKLVELLLAAQCARELGATEVSLVAPYLCYMRQDRAFQPGEAVSQRIIGRLLAQICDGLVTADPHLHRVHSLAEAVPVSPAVAISAAPLMGEFLAARSTAPLLVGPDRESEQWVSEASRRAGLDYVVAHKTRHGDRSVSVELPARDYAGVPTVLVDDVASSGHTLAEAARYYQHELRHHPLFAGDALAVLRAAGVSEVWSSDSIAHPSNAFSLAPALAAAVNSAGSGGPS